jgi:hypothetical protein
MNFSGQYARPLPRGRLRRSQTHLFRRQLVAGSHGEDGPQQPVRLGRGRRGHSTRAGGLGADGAVAVADDMESTTTPCKTPMAREKRPLMSRCLPSSLASCRGLPLSWQHQVATVTELLNRSREVAKPGQGWRHECKPGGSTAERGLVLRAGDPPGWKDPADEIACLVAVHAGARVEQRGVAVAVHREQPSPTKLLRHRDRSP